MKTKSLVLAAIVGLLSFNNLKADRYVGGDISELPTMEKAGAKFLEKDGKTAISDLITYSYDQGMNAMRVRLFVDPDNYAGSDKDQYACQSYDYILPICQRIKKAGHKLLLDFHYSDTWADPVKQWTPAAWATLSDEELYKKIYEYTKQVLTDLKAADAEPDFIQTGNEISYGMCWGPLGTSNSALKKAYTDSDNANLTRFKNLLENAIAACRAVSPEAGIILHNERTAKPSMIVSFFDWAKNSSLDYDIIGLSYYPYFHGNVSALDTALRTIESRNYGKDIWIVETGAAINWAIGDSDKQFYELTDAGQNQFATDLISVLDNHKTVTGLFWWEMDYNAYNTSLTGWYNASLFDNKTGRITSAFFTIANWGNGESAGGGDEEDRPTTHPDYYLLYNNGGDWDAFGTIFVNNQDGTYNLSNIHIYKDGEDNAWFAITSAYTNDWDELNANRFGPVNNNEDPTTMESSGFVQNGNSWQVPAGKYDILFDTNHNLIKITPAGASAIDNIISDDTNGKTEYYNLNGIKVINPDKGIYIKIVNGNATKVLIR